MFESEDWGSVTPLGFLHTGNRIRFGRASERAGEAKLCERVKDNFLDASGPGIKLSSVFFSSSSFPRMGPTWLHGFYHSDTIMARICLGLCELRLRNAVFTRVGSFRIGS